MARPVPARPTWPANWRGSWHRPGRPPAERMEIVQFHPRTATKTSSKASAGEQAAGSGTFAVDYPVRAGVFQRFCETTAASPGRVCSSSTRSIGATSRRLWRADAAAGVPRPRTRTCIFRPAVPHPDQRLPDRNHEHGRPVDCLVDFALRRRFHFFHCGADPTLLERWLAAHPVEPAYLLDLYRRLAEQAIDDPAFRIGPSHFMRPA